MPVDRHQQPLTGTHQPHQGVDEGLLVVGCQVFFFAAVFNDAFARHADTRRLCELGFFTRIDKVHRDVGFNTLVGRKKIAQLFTQVATHILRCGEDGDLDRLTEFAEHLARLLRQGVAAVLRDVADQTVILREIRQQGGEGDQQYNEEAVLGEHLKADTDVGLHGASAQTRRVKAADRQDKKDGRQQDHAGDAVTVERALGE